MPSSRRTFALLQIIKFVTNRTPLAGDDACIVPHVGPCRIYHSEMRQMSITNIRPVAGNHPSLAFAGVPL